MSYRMTFRFDDVNPTVEQEVIHSVTPSIEPHVQPQIRIVRKKTIRGRLQLSLMQVFALFFMVLFASVFIDVMHGQSLAKLHVNPYVSSVNQKPTSMLSPSDSALIDIAMNHRLMIAPGLQTWMIENGVYDTYTNASLAVRSNKASGVYSFASTSPPYAVFLAPVMDKNVMQSMATQWTASEIPYYLARWQVSQNTLSVPYLTAKQAGLVESNLLKEFNQLQALLDIQKVGKGEAQGLQSTALKLNGHGLAKPVLRDLTQLENDIQQAAELLSRSPVNNAYGAALAKAVYEYDLLSKKM